MARVFIEGFELRHLQNWDEVYGNLGENDLLSGATVYGLSGNYYCYMDSDQYLKKVLATAGQYYASMRYYEVEAGVNSKVMYFYNESSGLMGSLYANHSGGDNKMNFVCAGTTYAGTVNLTTAQAWRVEVRYKPSTTNDGVIQVKVNGILDINKTSTLTSSTGTSIKFINFYGRTARKVDDIIIDNSEWIGNTRIQQLMPDGSGTSTNWTPSAVYNYDCVNDLSTDVSTCDADYVYASTVNALDAYAMSTLISGTNPISEIKCIQVTARAKIDGVCTANAMKLKVITSNATYESSAIQVQEDAWAHYTYIKSDTANITVAKMENISIGLETTKV